MPLQSMGMNFFPTKRNNWSGFSERKHKTTNGEQSEYYYRMSAANLLNTQIDLPLDIEPIIPGENEVAASRRIIERLCENCGSLFDVIIADALYMEGPFINFCADLGKNVIVVLKNNYPSLIEDAQGIFNQTQPEIWNHDNRIIRAWDSDGFVTDTVDVPLRVLRTEETYTKKVIKNGSTTYEQVTVIWWWATTIPSDCLTTKQLWKLGHSRWQIENNIFNTLGQHWGLNHCYKHQPIAIVNFVLCLFIAFTMLQCFYKRNLKPQMRRIINSLIALANQIHAGLAAVFERGATICSAPP